MSLDSQPSTLNSRLHRIRRAFHAQMFVARLTETALMLSSAWLVWIALSALTGRAIWQPWVALAAALLAFAAAAIWTQAQTLSLAATAARMDRLAQTRDRFTTALALQTPGSELESRAAAECDAFLARFDEKPWTRLRWPRRLAALLVPVVATVMLAWLLQPLPPSADDLAKRDAANARAHALEQLAAQVQQLDPPEMKRLAEQMKQSAQKIAAAKTGDDAEKAALRAISEIEAGLKNSALAAQQAQLDALANALAATPPTQKAAQDLQDRKLADAAQALAEAAKKMDAETAKQLAKAMKRALQQLGQSSSEGALAQSMSQLVAAPASASSQAMSQALQKLAQMLAQQAGAQNSQNSSAQNPGRSATEQEILNMLENLKQSADAQGRKVASMGQPDGSGKPGESGKPGPGSQPSMQDFAKGNAPGPMQLGMMPSGQPGSEHDTGTTKTPYGEKNALNQPSTATQLQGLLGQGESLQTLVQSAGGSGKAARSYRALYNAMVPAAEQTVDQEAIPAGSRTLIKRYFESIRPPE
jgi:hypothetical protein